MFRCQKIKTDDWKLVVVNLILGMQRCCHFTWLMCRGKLLIILHRFKGQTDRSRLLTDKWNVEKRESVLLINYQNKHINFFDLLIAGFTTIQSQSPECFKLFVLTVQYCYFEQQPVCSETFWQKEEHGNTPVVIRDAVTSGLCVGGGTEQ